MKSTNTYLNQLANLLTILCFAIMPLAVHVAAQTPESVAPEPVPTVEESNSVQEDGTLTGEQPPVENPPVENPAPVDSSIEPPAENPPAEAPPAENPPAEAPPAENPPAEAPPAENPPAEAPPAENPPAEAPPAENPPAEAPPAENPPAEQQPAENPPADEPTEDEPPAKDASTEAPPTDDPADGEATDGEDSTAPDTEVKDESTSESSTDDGDTELSETPDTEATEEVENENASTPESEIEDDSEPATPTPTEEVIVPDELELVGNATISIAPGEYRDVVVRYTLGSDRVKTELSANLTAPGGESLDDWTLVPWQRVDLDEDPADVNRHLKARYDHVENMESGDVFETSWRITAPDHIETPVTVRFHTSSKIHREDGVTDGVIMNDFVTINATASVHTPTFTCDAVVAEDVSNSWNCAFDTTHPDDDLLILVSADVPEGWEISLDGSGVTSDPVALDSEAITQSGFAVNADYPLGCPTGDGASIATLNLSMAYPSGEVIPLQADLPVGFEKPESMLSISSFGFDDVDLRNANMATGQLVLSHESTPCAWEATIQLTDLESDGFTIPSDAISINAVDGLPNATITLDQGVIIIRSTESEAAVPAGELAIHFTVQIPEHVQPGAYRIGIETQFIWLTE